MKKFLFVIAILGGIQWYIVHDGCGTRGAVACPPKELEEGVGVALAARDVCPNAGYLCYQRASFQVMRWPLEKGRLRIRVPLPDFVDAQTAEELRESVVAGIMEWDSHPFPIVVDTGKFAIRTPDITVSWGETMNAHGGSAGAASPYGREDGKRIRFEVVSLGVLVPKQFSSMMGGMPLPDEIKGKLGLHEMGPAVQEWVRATAAHELGHALGLMHSDSANDLMYFQMRQGTVQPNVSARDIQTVEALYALPNGAMVSR